MTNGWGVIGWNHRIVCYELVDEFGPVTQPYGEGGTMTMQARTGRKVPEARILGSKTLLEMTPELLAAIEADLRQAKK